MMLSPAARVAAEPPAVAGGSAAAQAIPERRYALRLPAPEPAQLRDAAMLVGDAYEGLLARSGTHLDDVIHTLLEAVHQTDDAARKYALLLAAENSAVEQLAYRKAFAVLAERTSHFVVEPLPARLDLLRRIANEDKPLDAEFLGLAAQTARDAVTADDFTAADDAVALADRAARFVARERKAQAGHDNGGEKAAGATAPKAGFEEVTALRKFIREERKLAAHYLKAKKLLLAEPDDSHAAGVVGRHLCFVKEHWLEGLRMLARSDDARLSSLAADELTLLHGTRLDAVASLAVAGGWWKCAGDTDVVPPAHAARVKAHAAAIYRRISASLQDPVDVALAQTRSGDEADAIRAPLGEPWAAARWPGDVVANSIGMKLVLVPAGSFTMGSPASEAGRERDEDSVPTTVSQPLLMGQTEVTQKQWADLMGTTPWRGRAHVVEAAHLPATCISWEAARDFCQRLTMQERDAGRIPDTVAYRLPSEAQWEYACRAGEAACYGFGHDHNLLHDHAWAHGLAEANRLRHAQAVGQKAANRFGLFDMHGNVWEWCLDGYAKELPGGVDPLVHVPDAGRVARGGSWNWGPFECRSANRQAFPADKLDLFDVGFRVVRTFDPAEVDTEERTARHPSDQASAPAG